MQTDDKPCKPRSINNKLSHFDWKPVYLYEVWGTGFEEFDLWWHLFGEKRHINMKMLVTEYRKTEFAGKEF